MSDLLLILPLSSIACAATLWAILGKPRFLKKRPARENQETDLSISVIIPARDEEQNIQHLLKSLHNQLAQPLDIIVVNDGSQDQTAQVAAHLGANVINAEELPPGWKGKSWACHQGAQHARGEWLLFLDADLLLEKEALSSLLELNDTKTTAFSIYPYHSIDKFYEEFSSFFNVLMLAGSNAYSPLRKSKPLLFGQCLFVRKNHYFKIGTHESIKDEILENFQLSKQFENHGISCLSLLGKNLISMRMFPEGFTQLCTSWQKGFTSGATQTTPRTLVLSSIWLTGLMLVLTSIILIIFQRPTDSFLAATGFAYLAGVMQCCYAFQIAGSFSLLNALFFPLTLVFYQGIFFYSLAKKTLGIKPNWKGRQID